MTRKEILMKYKDCQDREFVNMLFRKLDGLGYFDDEWVARSGQYHKLDWRNNERGIGKTIDMLDFKLGRSESLKIIDAGAGTGKISLAIAEYTDQKEINVEIYAVDQSYAMLEKCPEHKKIKKYIADIEHMTFISDNSIDRVICSMVLHSEYKHVGSILREFWRILKKGGILVIFESIPMVDDSDSGNLFLAFYMSFLTLKEDRVMFTKNGLIEMIGNADFGYVVIEEIVLEQQSIKNWLHNSCTEDSLADKIMGMHIKALDVIKKGINMTESERDNDILCDWKFGIAKGIK